MVLMPYPEDMLMQHPEPGFDGLPGVEALPHQAGMDMMSHPMPRGRWGAARNHHGSSFMMGMMGGGANMVGNSMGGKGGGMMGGAMGGAAGAFGTYMLCKKNERVHPEVHVGAPRLLRLPRHVREIECSRCCCRRRGRLWPWAEVYARISGSRRSRSNGQTWVWAAFHLGRVEHSSSFRPLAKNGSARGGPGCMPTREAKSTCSFFRLGGLSRSAAGKGHMNSP